MKSLTKEQVKYLKDSYRIGTKLIEYCQNGDFFTPEYFFPNEYSFYQEQLEENSEGDMDGLTDSFEDFEKWLDGDLESFDFVDNRGVLQERKRHSGRVTLDQKEF